MDHTWMEYTAAQQAYASSLRVPAAAATSQINSGSHPHQYPHPNRNLHQPLNHMATFNNAACQKSSGAGVAKSSKQSSIGSQLTAANVNSQASHHHQHPTGHHHQSMMNSHHQYNASSNGSPWFFNSRQQSNSHDSSLQVRNHPERGNPSFNASASFGLHPSHTNVYDTSSFMSAQFPQHQPKSNYVLPSMTAAPGFMQGKKQDATVTAAASAEMNPYCGTSAYHCPSSSMKGVNMTGMPSHCSNSNANLNSGSFFSATNGWPHHQNLLPTNTPSSGMLPQETVNMINPSHTASSATSIPRGYSRSSNSSCAANNVQAANSLNGYCDKSSCSVNKHSNSGHQSTAVPCDVGVGSASSAINGGHGQSQYKNNASCATAAAAAAAAATQYPNNSYLMQGFPSNRSGQNSFVDPALGAKFAAAAAHHQVASDYASFAASFAAAAMNSDYASFQQAQHKHQQYMSTMNNFGANGMNTTHGHNNDYHHAMQQFDHTTNFNANRHSNSFMNYCSAPIFPMAHSDASMNSANIKSHHNTLFDDFNYAATASAPNSLHNYHNQTANAGHSAHQSLTGNQSTSTSKSTATRKSQKRSQSYNKPEVNVNTMTASFNEQHHHQQQHPQQPTHQQYASSANCNNLLLPNGNSSSCMVASASATNVPRSSVSRCSSVASTSNHQPMQQQQHHQQHQQQQQQQHGSSDPYSYNYSPATTNLSSHSPYQQRSSTSNSSHSSGASCAMSNSDYLSYGTPNPGQTVFPAMGTSQTPTPTPGYPTPPSSVGHSNSRCNSNEELSPYSSNSMSSSISHQSYGRNDFKSSASSSSQISPKQLDSSSISDSMPQFNSSCMVAASQKNAAAIASESAISSQSKHLLSAANMFDATNPLDDSYKSQQFSVSYGNPLSSSAPASACSNEMYMNYGSEQTGAMPLVDPQEALVDNGEAEAMDDSTYSEYHHYDAADANAGQFDTSYVDAKADELPSCVQQQVVNESTVHQSNSAHIIEPKGGAADYPSGPEHESFNLNFNSVIQPIEVEHMPEQQDPIQEQMPTSHNVEMNSLDSLTGSLSDVDKSAFPSIDDLNFIAHSETDTHCALEQTNHGNFAPDNQQQPQQLVSTCSEPGTAAVNTIEHCSSLEFPSSHRNDHLLENTAMECNNIQSIIDSLPKTDDCLQTNKNDDPSEVLSQCSNSDSFLSDLAPLMNDNSKIALMESTFKSNNSIVSSISKDLDIVNPSFENNKVIFSENSSGDQENDDLKMDHEPSIESESDDNRLKDVDDFLESNLNSEVQPEPEPQPVIDHPPPKSNIEDTIDCVARLGGLQDFDDEELELKISNKSRKSHKRAERKKSVKENAENSATLKDNQSKFFKRKTSDPPFTPSSLPPIDIGCSSAKKRKIAVVLPKTKDGKKPPGAGNEYDFLDGVAKDKPTKKVTKKPSPTSTETTKVIKQKQAKVQVKIEASKDAETKIVETKPEETVDENKPESAVPSKSKPKTVAEVAPSCASPIINSIVKEEVLQQTDILVVPVKAKHESISADTSPTSLSETKENVAVIKPSKSTSKSKHPNGSNKTKTPVSLSNKSDKPPSSGGVSKKSEKHKPAVSIVKNIKPKLSPSPANLKPDLKTVPLVSPKTSLASIVSTNSSTLLPQTSLINASCLNKPVAPANTFNLTPAANARLSSVTPTLIMNPIENQPVNSYVSPVTNAVLISIHPANSAPMSSLTAPSTFITLNTQNVSSSNNGSTTSSNVATQSSSSRRRSQDKKVAQVKEGLMRTGDFVVAEEEASAPLPVIWRIEGKSLLQRFEPSEQNGVTVYTNTSSYSAWNPTVRQKYLGLDVRIMGCNRTRIIVEKLGLTQAKGTESSVASVNDKEISSSTSDSPSPQDISQCLESFEVEIQTLISQALDSKFMADVIKEKDEYFLTHIQTVEDLCSKRRARFISFVKWDINIVKCIETYPEIQIQNQNDVGDLRCRLCHDNWSTKILHFDGKMYNFETLESLPPQPESKQTKLACCEMCTDRTFIYSKLYHQKYNFLQKCKSKAEGIYSLDENKASDVVLEECLGDGDWIRKLFSELESLLISCDNLR